MTHRQTSCLGSLRLRLTKFSLLVVFQHKGARWTMFGYLHIRSDSLKLLNPAFAHGFIAAIRLGYSPEKLMRTEVTMTLPTPSVARKRIRLHASTRILRTRSKHRGPLATQVVGCIYSVNTQSPGRTSSRLFVLHEGFTKNVILQSSGSYRVLDTRTGGTQTKEFV